jgi:glycosyltransferase involved in cell wall biosynthesis
VCLLNCHHNKGGFLIIDLIKKLNIKIPLLFVYTEYDENLELSEIKQLINERNSKNNINLLFEEKQNPKDIYEKSKLMLIPSLCDETFCRVAYESKMNNIPIISTSNGNLKYLLKNYALFIDSNQSNDWIKNIENLYFKINLKKNNSLNAINSYENKIKNNVNELINEAVISKYKKNKKNIAIICPWADQGLGIQARSYYNSLKNLDYNVYIFSFKPYHGNESNNFLQHKKEEWDYENVYYSPNYRENIDPFEILNFIHDNHISKLILIEASFEQIFLIHSLLKLCYIKIYLIINIECVKISEINNHLLFDKILCNNFNSYFIMNNLLNSNVHFLGFHLEHNFFSHFSKPIFEINNTRKIKFVCSGGLNSISRKNIDVIFDSFLEIFNEFENLNLEIELNILIQSIECPSNLKIDHPNINKQIKYLSYVENLESIGKNDIFIHCGGQEGLGLGFYEALYLGLPIVTLDWTPNNELIKENYNGWLVDVKIDKVYENTECLINRALINKEEFKNKIINIAKNRENTINIINNTIHNKDFFIKKNKTLFEKNLELFLD